MLSETVSWWTVLAALMPVLVGIVTKSGASSALKGTVLLFLDAAYGFLMEWQAAPDGFSLEGAMQHWIVAFVLSVAAYFGWLKDTIVPPVNAATANIGIGAPQTGPRRTA